jgi:hypothetical protein
MRRLALISCLLATACGGSRNAESTAQDLADAICDLAFRCCDRGEVNYYFGPFFTEDDCSERLMNAAGRLNNAAIDFSAFENVGIRIPNVAVLNRAVEDGRVAIDGTALNACLDHIRDAECNPEVAPEPEDPPEDCVPAEEEEEGPCQFEEIFIGAVDVGGSCSNPELSIECKQGLTCRAVSSLGDEGVCIEPGEVGEYCIFSAECRDELYCSLLDGTCQVPRQEGETCLYADDEETILLACDDNLACDPLTDTCVPQCSRGYACFVDSQCSATDGLVCILGRCDAPRTEGQSCGEVEDCVDGLRCAPNPDPNDAGQICSAPLANGEVCNGRDLDCASGYCANDTNLCTVQANPGELCLSNDNDQCAGGYCDRTVVACSIDAECPGSNSCSNGVTCDPFCVTLKPDGATCDSFFECQSGSCYNNLCRSLPLADNEECNFDNECESNFCNDYDFPAVCMTLPLANGDACGVGSQCASEVCFQGSCQTGLTDGADCSASPFTDPPCAKGLFCYNDDVTQTCTAQYPAGSECENDVECVGFCSTSFGRPICAPAADEQVCTGGDVPSE